MMIFNMSIFLRVYSSVKRRLFCRSERLPEQPDFYLFILFFLIVKLLWYGCDDDIQNEYIFESVKSSVKRRHFYVDLSGYLSNHILFFIHSFGYCINLFIISHFCQCKFFKALGGVWQFFKICFFDRPGQIAMSLGRTRSVALCEHGR